MVFVTPNDLCGYRAESFSTKEPETLEWIDSFEPSSVFWDIGANVGLYSVYAAKSKNCKVWAFEPSIFNLECLARNTFLNRLTSRVTIVPIALNDYTKASELHMTTTNLGGALSTFDKSFGHDGKKLHEIFKFRTLGVSMDEAVKNLNISAPSYLKIDVDGIEHLILSGGIKTLRAVKSVLIEVNEAFDEMRQDCSEILKSAGLTLRSRRQGPDMAKARIYANTFNQIWRRESLT